MSMDPTSVHRRGTMPTCPAYRLRSRHDLPLVHPRSTCGFPLAHPASDSVEQTGTDSDCDGGSPGYYGWYEMYPADPVSAPGHPQPQPV